MRCVLVHRDTGRRCKGLVRNVPGLCRRHARSWLARELLYDGLTRAEILALSAATWATRAEAPPEIARRWR
jgi:hypothetical protein